jgi:hypothetical protein
MGKSVYLPEKIKSLISGKDYVANEVGIKPNMEKIRYYILLDELY